MKAWDKVLKNPSVEDLRGESLLGKRKKRQRRRELSHHCRRVGFIRADAAGG